MSIDLLLCPFCGGEAFFHDGADNDGQFVAVGCECGVGTGKHYPIMDDARPNAANEWNKRAPLASRALPAAPDVGDEKEAAALFAMAWEPAMPSIDGTVKAMAVEVARIREQARREAIAEIAAWIRPQRNNVPMTGEEAANAIEALTEAKS